MVDKIDHPPMDRTLFYDCQGHFIPTLPLDDLPWFPDFKRSLKGFRMGGFHLIHRRFVDRFLEVVKLNRLATPSHQWTSLSRLGEEAFIPTSRVAAVAGYRTPLEEIDRAAGARPLEGLEEPTAETEVTPNRAILSSAGPIPYLEGDEADLTDDTGAAEGGYQPTTEDYRERVNRQIMARRGQKKFRDTLRKRYGDCCMISGCLLLDVLEAAHIKPYRGPNDNNPENGLLLRADLHTLFDLDLLGIEPSTLRVHLHPDVRLAGYNEFENQTLKCPEYRPSEPALLLRWEDFQRRLPIGTGPGKNQPGRSTVHSQG
jgi:hypothetical protein